MKHYCEDSDYKYLREPTDVLRCETSYLNVLGSL